MSKPDFGLTRTTNQRQVILDYIVDASLTHPTADHIFQAVRKKLPRISFGTVYRNLGVLEDQEKIKALYYCKDHVRYDAILGNHYHFVCEHCDKVENIIFEELFEINEQVKKRHALKVNHHRIYFYGLCRDCEKQLKLKVKSQKS